MSAAAAEGPYAHGHRHLLLEQADQLMQQLPGQRIDLRKKVAAYGSANVPVYVIVDRKHERLHVLTEPMEDGYAVHRIHVAGEKVTLPESIGASVTLDVAQVLEDSRRRTPRRR